MNNFRFVRRLVLAGALGCLLGAAPGWAEEQVPASVVVVDGEGEEIRSRRYVAIVPQDHPWREPVEEAVVEAGRAVPRFFVPAGRYGVVCAAEGFGFRLLRDVQLTASGTSDLLCALRDAAPRRGTIVDAATGQPIAGAVVSLAGHFRLGSDSAMLSPLGMEMLRGLLSARSGDDGEFQLSGTPGGRGLAWVEAEGYAPLDIPLLEFSADGSPFPPIRLSKGGQLRVSLELPGGFPADRYRLVLKSGELEWPHHGVSPTPRETRRSLDLRHRLVPRLWRRPVVAERPSSTHWSSLPPGPYEVWLKGADLGDHADLPYVLGAVTVRAGEMAELGAGIDWQAPRSAAEGKGAELRLLVPSSLEEGTELVADLWRDGLKVRRADVSAEIVSGGTLVRLEQACRDGFSVTLASESEVSAAIDADPDVCGEGRISEAPLRPATELEGALAVPRGLERPKGGAVWASSCTDSEGELGPYPVEISEQGTLRGSVASACGELTLLTKGFAPLHWSGVASSAGGSLDLGRRQLQPGGSLLLRVSSSVDQSAFGNARIELFEAGDTSAILEAGLRGEGSESPWRQITDSRGWARFAGLEPKTYVARINSAQLTLPSFTKPFTLRAGEELILENIEISPPVAVALAIEDPRGLLAAGDRLRIDASTDVASCGFLPALDVEAEVPAEGAGAGFRVELPPLLAGSWRIHVLRDDAFGTPHVLGDSEFLVTGPGPVEEALALDADYFYGVVTHRDEPVKARLELVPRPSPQEALSVRVRSDEEGRFQVPLDRAGQYDVRVHSRESKLSLTVPGIHFESPEEEVRIEVPEARFVGRVVDAAGRPVREGVVLAQSLSSEDAEELIEAGAFVQEDGTFEIAGVTPGRWTLEASVTKKRSRPITLSIGKDEEMPDLELRLESGLGFTGRVSSAGRPVANAEGGVVSLAVDIAAMGGYAGFTTDPDGLFEASLTPGSEGEVNIVVEAAGWPVTAFRAKVPGELDLDLPPHGGTLRILGAGSENAGGRSTFLVLASRHGGAIPLAGLRSLRRQDDLATLDNLAPGSWRLLSVPRAGGVRRWLRHPGSTGTEVLAEFVIGAGDTVEVALPRDG